jgi:hypothetical protein
MWYKSPSREVFAFDWPDSIVHSLHAEGWMVNYRWPEQNRRYGVPVNVARTARLKAKHGLWQGLDWAVDLGYVLGPEEDTLDAPWRNVNKKSNNNTWLIYLGERLAEEFILFICFSIRE